jgi:ribosomal protein L11 methyltransferase
LSLKSDSSEDTFLQIEILVSPELREPTLEVLWETETLGCEEVERDEGLLVRAYFPSTSSEHQLEAHILSTGQASGWKPLQISLSRVHFSFQDWLKKFSETFKEFPIGNSFYIYPSWGRPSPDYPVNLLLDPGHAFGTGTHESTQLALLALEDALPGVGSMLDIGTGNGILTIAAKKLDPCLEVVALDIDPLSVFVARENLQRNCIAHGKLVVGDTRSIALEFDLVVANLTAGILQNLAKEIGRVSHGYVVLSGFTVEQGPLVLEHMNPYFELLETYEKRDWICYRMRSW